MLEGAESTLPARQEITPQGPSGPMGAVVHERAGFQPDYAQKSPTQEQGVVKRGLIDRLKSKLRGVALGGTVMAVTATGAAEAGQPGIVSEPVIDTTNAAVGDLGHAVSSVGQEIADGAGKLDDGLMRESLNGKPVPGEEQNRYKISLHPSGDLPVVIRDELSLSGDGMSREEFDNKYKIDGELIGERIIGVKFPSGDPASTVEIKNEKGEVTELKGEWIKFKAKDAEGKEKEFYVARNFVDLGEKLPLEASQPEH